MDPAPAGWFKLDLDASSLGNPGLAGIGDENCNVIMSYSGPAGICDVNKASGPAILFGLHWYEKHNLGPLIMEGDSTNTIVWASNRSGGPWCLSNIIDEIRDLVRILQPRISHRRRSANTMADELAKSGVDRPQVLLSIHYPLASPS
ncbi:uncharacterized protein LOC143864464 [Tasmannia lanceolata]|uniref:uncharacterized protein LOC143864464 n=1 Tax=Tasmannia lanceolata TaxID=3420 RepID=UPI0040640848